jgi:hypothetical protein
MANWCTFATWASKQAGQSIRREDLLRALEARLDLSRLDELKRVWKLARELGVSASVEQEVVRLISTTWLARVVDPVSSAVARGNQKVFEEIGWEFARFLPAFFHDKTFDQQRLDSFCAGFKQGNPPEGQDYLRQAFTNYYTALFEKDPQLRTELQLLANLQIGFHEQTRLQPEIAASLNASFAVDRELVRKKIIDSFFPPASWLSRIRLAYLNLTGQTSPLELSINRLLDRVQSIVREVMTAHLMTLTFPPDLRLALGKDLNKPYPELLVKLTCKDLLNLLTRIDPTPDSLSKSGAIDWSDLPDRMHFITELFRCYHLDPTLFVAPFTPEQVASLKAGKLPTGRL